MPSAVHRGMMRTTKAAGTRTAGTMTGTSKTTAGATTAATRTTTTAAATSRTGHTHSSFLFFYHLAKMLRFYERKGCF